MKKVLQADSFGIELVHQQVLSNGLSEILHQPPDPKKKMSDDKTKKKIDAWFLSLTEKYEVDYFVTDIKRELPAATTEQIHEALKTCVDEIRPSEGRARIKACVLAKLKHLVPCRPDKDDRPKQPSRTHA